MGWVHLQSSVFKAARYSEKKRLLYLEFCSGAIYRYFEFPAHQYCEFLAADSHGRYFNRHIVGRFPEEMVRPPRRKPA
jgi:KTSC domain